MQPTSPSPNRMERPQPDVRRPALRPTVYCPSQDVMSCMRRNHVPEGAR